MARIPIEGGRKKRKREGVEGRRRTNDGNRNDGDSERKREGI